MSDTSIVQSLVFEADLVYYMRDATGGLGLASGEVSVPIHIDIDRR